MRPSQDGDDGRNRSTTTKTTAITISSSLVEVVIFWNLRRRKRWRWWWLYNWASALNSFSFREQSKWERSRASNFLPWSICASLAYLGGRQPDCDALMRTSKWEGMGGCILIAKLPLPLLPLPQRMSHGITTSSSWVLLLLATSQYTLTDFGLHHSKKEKKNKWLDPTSAVCCRWGKSVSIFHYCVPRRRPTGKKKAMAPTISAHYQVRFLKSQQVLNL